jgi:hypothetical protein
VLSDVVDEERSLSDPAADFPVTSGPDFVLITESEERWRRMRHEDRAVREVDIPTAPSPVLRSGGSGRSTFRQANRAMVGVGVAEVRSTGDGHRILTARGLRFSARIVVSVG